MKRAAICLRGAVAQTRSPFITEEGYSNRSGDYVNYRSCFNSIIKHIVNCNIDYDFDFYIHCWSYDLEKDLISLYKPKKCIFENNDKYTTEISSKISNPKDFSPVSQTLSLKKSIGLVDGDYDTIIVYRPDLLLWKDIDLNAYNMNNIYVNAHQNCEGDFHFIMNMDNAKKLEKLYDLIGKIKINTAAHFITKDFIVNFLKENLVMDQIFPGKDQEVLRKLNAVSINVHKIPIETFFKYGLTKSEILKYNSP